VSAALGSRGAQALNEKANHTQVLRYMKELRVSETSAIRASFILRATPELSRHNEGSPGQTPRA